MARNTLEKAPRLPGERDAEKIVWQRPEFDKAKVVLERSLFK